MSYCRWSSDNFNCDIYAYHSVGDFYQIHVGSGRYKGEIPKVEWPKSDSEEDIQLYLKQNKIRSEYLDTCGTEPIGLPYDGESYTCDTLEEFYDKMVELRSVGYRFPNYVLESIRAEMKEIS